MRLLSEWRFIWCAIFTGTFVAICVSHATERNEQSNPPKVEDYSLGDSIDKRLDQVYQGAIASANEQQRAIFESEHARWFLEREKLKNDPDVYLAYTQQEIRYFAGTYEEPSGVLTSDDLSPDKSFFAGTRLGMTIEQCEAFYH